MINCIVCFSLLLGLAFINGQSIIQYRPDTILVRFEDGVSIEEKNTTLNSLQAISIRELDLVPNLYQVKLPASSPIQTYITELKNTRGIQYAEPDYIRSVHKLPNDTYYVDNQLWNMTKIQAEMAWDIRTESYVVVAVLDTGIDYTHEDLKNVVWKNRYEENGIPGKDDDNNGYVDDIWGWNTVENNPNPFDDYEHGTHCAGTIGGEGNNSIGVVGVCWKIQIVAVKFLDKDGYGSISDEIEGMKYITKTPAKIINMSFGSYGYSQAEYDAILQLQKKGILCVCAAGNEQADNDIEYPYPCSYPLDNIISVAASGYDDQLASSFSNYGRKTVHLLAPGYHIWSSVPEFFNEWKYDWHHGTSMATPHVAGTAALVWSQFPTYNYLQVRSRILDNVDNIPGAPVITSGRLNVYRALHGPDVSDETNHLGGCSGNISQPSFPRNLTYSLPYLITLLCLLWMKAKKHKAKKMLEC